ncbi:MAG: nucleotidyl transferase AbiEii/AbiGii toxin family protein [Nocardioides sp.]|uniref:nucleotidyl transferase AbiEii/AbiGii toxin family protein n=1 Tax=Nocardioides sp. TaxID=35761 RepID=UPI0039E6DD6E
MSDSEERGLSHFQLEIASLFFSLPESAGFLLAGGGALIAQGLVSRETEDLDFFTQRGGAGVERAAAALIAAAEASGWTTTVIRSGPEFRRIGLTRPDQPSSEQGTLYIDLAIDAPPDGAPTLTVAGPALSPRELAIRKTLALFSRAEPRDFADVYAIHQHFDRSEILTEAAAADAGFDIGVFVQMLRSHKRLCDNDFPPTGVSVEELRRYFDDWADDLGSDRT